MKLIVGLGNPGDEFERSRHNLGFMVLDSMAALWGVHFEKQKKLKSELLVTMKDGETIILAKPQTFMNHSGVAVQKIANFYKLKPKDVWVISDDIDLDFGLIRTRVGGRSGGHNGLQNIIDSIGEGFVRIRVGIGSNRGMNIPAENYVLQPFSTTQTAQLGEVIENVITDIADYLETPPKPTTKK
jgi:PTH1 family peptidyl-tRNA hydrolase